MKSVLLGNGINIEFGGKAYSNYFIMERIKYRAKLDGYKRLFNNTLSSSEIIGVLDGFVGIANDIRDGAYDCYGENYDIKTALDNFKDRYPKTVTTSNNIMLEDWFLLLEMFFMKNRDLKKEKEAAIQGFERLILDAIYNDGKIQNLYNKMSKKVKRFFCDYDNIFTLNYDNNIEKLTGRKVYHLHGDFSVLANSENTNNVQGFLRAQESNIVVVKGMEHCFCNALLNYSGALKYKTAKAFHDSILKAEKLSQCYENDFLFRNQLSDLKLKSPLEYKWIMTKIKHPELNMATEYYFDTLEKISDELHIIGMSPNNDAHIFDLVRNNRKLKKIVFYYFEEKDRKYMEKYFSKEKLKCEKVSDLWEKLGHIKKRYNCNYNIPSNIDDFIACSNELSGSYASKQDVLEEIKYIPQFEMEHLCGLVKEDMKRRNPKNEPTDREEFDKSRASISYIALREGVLPTILYMICVMNMDILKNDNEENS